jgi:hypothetical protein
MDSEKTKVEKFIDFGKFQILRSKVLSVLLFRTAKLENERRQLLHRIGQFYCDQFDLHRDTFQAPEELAAVFRRHHDVVEQLKAHYDQIQQQPKAPTPPDTGTDGQQP